MAKELDGTDESGRQRHREKKTERERHTAEGVAYVARVAWAAGEAVHTLSLTAHASHV